MTAGVDVKMTPSHPGDFIRTEIIEELGLSVTKAAEVLGVRRATLSALLHAKAALSPEMALRIEMAFDVSMDMLMRMQAWHDTTRMRAKAHEIEVRRYVAASRSPKAGFSWPSRSSAAPDMATRDSGLENLPTRPHLRSVTTTEQARMAKKPRDTVTYDLKRGREIVYRGTTNDPERREQEHRKQGKDFDRLDVTSRRMTDEGAKAKEAENLAKYRKGHGGRNPQYNDDANG